MLPPVPMLITNAFIPLSRPSKQTWQRHWRVYLSVSLLVLLSACGGGGSSSTTTTTNNNSGTTNLTPTFASAASYAKRCESPRSESKINPATQTSFGDVQGTLTNEKQWIRSWIHETYLWYEEVPDPPIGNFSDKLAYFDALKTSALTPSGKAKDQFHFTYNTDDYNTLIQSGTALGYGFNLSVIAKTPPRRNVIAYVDSQTPADLAGLTRGTEILRVDGVDLVNDNTASGLAILNEGLFPTTATAHTFEVRDLNASTNRSVTLMPTVLSSLPVRNVKTLDAPHNQVGYMQFDDHIASAESLLAGAINQLKNAQITDLVLDLRYNGGGYLYLASELAYMIAGPSNTANKTFEKLTFNNKNPFNLTTAASITPFYNTTTDNQILPYLGLNRVFVLVGGGTCSASESIINGLRGVGIEVVLIGNTTCGKPYGFLPTDNCSTTYFAIQFQGVNQLGYGDYADGFSPTCVANDDFFHDLGDPAETRLAAALFYRNNQICPTGTPTAVQISPATRLSSQVAWPLAPSLLRQNRLLGGR